MVFCGLFPIEQNQFPELRDALEKLTLNDAALQWEPETSDALGFGFRCGFLGLLHMDIVRERLEREYDLDLMATMPSVEFEVELTDGEIARRPQPDRLPRPVADRRGPRALRAREHPHAEGVHRHDHGALPGEARHAPGDALPVAPTASSSPTTCRSPRSSSTSSTSSSRARAATRRWTTSRSACARRNLVKLDVLLSGDPVDALSMIVHRDKAYDIGRTLAEKLRQKIPRQQFDVPIQAAIGAKIVARETVKAFRKDVTAKCYGGDITRKRKLLERQKEGKKRMKQVGRIEIPQEAFLAVLELGDSGWSSSRAAARSAPSPAPAAGRTASSPAPRSGSPEAAGAAEAASRAAAVAEAAVSWDRRRAAARPATFGGQVGDGRGPVMRRIGVGVLLLAGRRARRPTGLGRLRARRLVRVGSRLRRRIGRGGRLRRGRRGRLRRRGRGRLRHRHLRLGDRRVLRDAASSGATRAGCGGACVSGLASPSAEGMGSSGAVPAGAWPGTTGDRGPGRRGPGGSVGATPGVVFTPPPGR